MVTTCPACGNRWGGKRQAQQVNRKAALQTWDKLKDVQQDMCWFSYRFKVGTKQQLADAFFSTRKDKKVRWNITKNHLNHLVSVGLVIRHEGDKKHNHRAFYYLTPEGVYCCQAEERKGGRNVKKIKALKAPELIDSPKWKHALYLNDVMASFITAERKGLGELQAYWGDYERVFRFKSLGGSQRLLPDSTILWTDGERTYLCWLELENRRGSYDDIVEKIRKYILLWRAGNFSGDTYKVETGQDAFPVLLVVGVKRGELPGLRQAIISGVLAAKVGTLQEISKHVVIGLAALDDVVDIGVLAAGVWESPLQGSGRLHSFEELFGLR